MNGPDGSSSRLGVGTEGKITKKAEGENEFDLEAQGNFGSIQRMGKMSSFPARKNVLTWKK